MSEPEPNPPPSPRSLPDHEAPRGRLRRGLGLALEGFISLGLAFLCFLVFLWVLDTVFPSSFGLRNQLIVERDRHDPWGLKEVPGTPRKAPTAVLKVFSNEVRLRTADQIAWGSAREGGSVHEGDAVQTRRDGQAMLRFTDGSTLHLGRNSLLVVRDNKEALVAIPAFEVPQGELWGTLPARGEDQIQVRTPNAQVVVEPGAGSGRQPDFKVLVGPDRSSVVAVYRGSASVTSGSGTQEVRENHFVAVDSSGVQTKPELLPDAPLLTGPATGARYVYRDTPPRFAFQWTPVSHADGYRLVVSRDAVFQSVVLDRRLTDPVLDYGAFGTGQYYWRVSTLREQVEGRPSNAGSLQIVRDGDPPRLKVEFPEQAVNGDACTITGISDPGTRVFVAGTPAQVGSNGKFTCRVSLKRGKNVVVVESFDSAGNTAYASKIVEARY